MISNTTSSQNAALSFLKTAISNVQRQPVQTQSPSTVMDPDAAQKFRDEQARLKQTIQQLQAAKTESNAEKKEAARQKIERLKAQIQALRMMTGGDPKAVAKQAARLSRELASAAREYASASSGGAVSIPTATAPVTAENVSPENAKSVTPVPTIQAGTESTLSPNEEDANFAREARRLLNELKKMVQDAKEKMKAENNDTRAADQNLSDAAGSINAISMGSIAMPAGVSVSLVT